jgi:hypothetical protein
MSLFRRLESLVGLVNVSRNSSLTDLGGRQSRFNNITGEEEISLGVQTGGFRADSLLQIFPPFLDIQFGGDDVTTTILQPKGQVGDSLTVNFTNLFDARIIGHTLRLNQGRIRFHVDTLDFNSNVLRVVDGDVDMDDIDFANATGVNNDVAMVYKNTDVRYTENQGLIVTFFNVDPAQQAIIRGGTISGNPAPFVPYWRTDFYAMSETAVVPNGYLGVAQEDINKLQAVYISGENNDIPVPFPEVSLANKDDTLERPAVAICTEDVSSGDRAFFSRSGVIRDVDTSMWSFGDKLYLTSTGDLTNVRPSSYPQFIGTVLISDANYGAVDVLISNEDLLFSVVEKTVNYTIDLDDDVVLGDVSAGDITFTLPLAADASGCKFTIKKSNGSGGKLIIDSNGIETIDGELTQTLVGAKFPSVTVISDGTEWWII